VGAAVNLAVDELQLVVAGTAIDVDGQGLRVEVADGDLIVVDAHVDPATDGAPRPVQDIIAGAGQHVAFQGAAVEGDDIHAATGADVCANGAAIEGDGVVTEAADQVAIDEGFDTEVLGHDEHVVGELEVYPANPATFEHGAVTILEGADDLPSRHLEGVIALPLVQRLDGPPGHLEIVDVLGLNDGTHVVAGRNHQVLCVNDQWQGKEGKGGWQQQVSATHWQVSVSIRGTTT